MALTLFVQRSEPDVAIVRWFRDSKGNIDFASGPITRLPLAEFRTNGYDLVLQHFKDYLRTRLPESEVIRVFQPGEAKKLMKDCSVVDISRDPRGILIFSPKVIRKYDLSGLKGLGAESRRTIPEKSPPETFWKTFDDVLAIAATHS